MGVIRKGVIKMGVIRIRVIRMKVIRMGVIRCKSGCRPTLRWCKRNFLHPVHITSDGNVMQYSVKRNIK